MLALQRAVYLSICHLQVETRWSLHLLGCTQGYYYTASVAVVTVDSGTSRPPLPSLLPSLSPSLSLLSFLGGTVLARSPSISVLTAGGGFGGSSCWLVAGGVCSLAVSWGTMRVGAGGDVASGVAGTHLEVKTRPSNPSSGSPSGWVHGGRGGVCVCGHGHGTGPTSIGPDLGLDAAC